MAMSRSTSISCDISRAPLRLPPFFASSHHLPHFSLPLSLLTAHVPLLAHIFSLHLVPLESPKTCAAKISFLLP